MSEDEWPKSRDAPLFFWVSRKENKKRKRENSEDDTTEMRKKGFNFDAYEEGLIVNGLSFVFIENKEAGGRK